MAVRRISAELQTPRTVLPILVAAHRVGIDVEAILARLGIDPTILRGTERPLAMVEVAAIWDTVVEASGDPWFALRAAFELPVLNDIDYVMASASDLRHTADLMSSVWAVYGSSVRAEVASLADRAEFSIVVPGCDRFPTRAGLEYMFARVVVRLRKAFGASWRPLGVRFAWPEPASRGGAERWFGCPVRFDHASSALVVNHADLGRPFFPLADRWRSAQALPLGFDPGTLESVVVRVQRLLRAHDHNAVPSVRMVARTLGMSPRSLQRHLTAARTSFRALLDEARRDRVLALAGQPATSAELAKAGWFSDVATFYRAYRRWTGQAWAARAHGRDRATS